MNTDFAHGFFDFRLYTQNLCFSAPIRVHSKLV